MAASGRTGLYVYAATLLLSASLLFSVQPIFAKMVLPYLGGSPSVWAVAMCFFQAVLLAGYCYAHALNRFVSVRFAPVIHLSVCCIAALTLPFGLPGWVSEPATGNTYLWLISVLTIGVGVPFFAVSANAPLLQAWFAKSGHPDAADPYFLYGASNLGSLVSLLAYPFLIEPLFGVDSQRAAWAAGFLALMLTIAACGMLLIAALRGRDEDGVAAGDITNVGDASEAAEVSNSDRLGWIALAFIPSALLVAFTTHITTDIASAPFLWVIPLATFLATFVVVFRDTSLISHDWVLRLQPTLVVVTLLLVTIPSLVSEMAQGGVAFIAFVLTTLVCHRSLYDNRPAASKLTEFYLYMSLGGVLGGMFAAIIAPQLFNTVAEYPLLLVAGLLARPGLLKAFWASDERDGIVMSGAVAGVAVTAAIAMDLAPAIALKGGVIVLLLGVSIAVFLQWMREPWIVGGSLACIAAVIAGTFAVSGVYSERSFFGVSRVMMTEDGTTKQLVHGSTLHGVEKIFDEDGNRIKDPVPGVYYHPNGPMVRGFDVARQAAKGPLQIGVVGLGAGSLACFRKPEESIVFYEIDPVIDRIARDPKHFTFMSRCAPNAKTVMGDARLTLNKEKNALYDYLVIDAFSSDAVPAHLLSREALAMYLTKIKPDGLIAMHISNRHMELESVIAATAETLPGIHAVFVDHRKAKLSGDAIPSDVLFLTRNKATADTLMTWWD
ncbi:MAG: fused MFS/spermidine synthase, partial [Pseudomonadota bacterium]